MPVRIRQKVQKVLRQSRLTQQRQSLWPSPDAYLELDGEDLRRLPIEQRKARLAKLLTGAPSTIALNEHYDGDDAIIYGPGPGAIRD